jgi:type II secretory pathway component PulJ
MMINLIVAVLLTGIVTGGVWAGIVLISRQRRLIETQPALLDDIQRRLDDLDNMEKRLADMEERLEFTERLLSKQQDAARLPPPIG